jgi:hypothetical protein
MSQRQFEGFPVDDLTMSAQWILKAVSENLIGTRLDPHYLWILYLQIS